MLDLPTFCSVCALLCNELAHDGGDSAIDRAGVGGDCVLLHGVGDLSSARLRRFLQEDAGTGEWVPSATDAVATDTCSSTIAGRSRLLVEGLIED